MKFREFMPACLRSPGTLRGLLLAVFLTQPALAQFSALQVSSGTAAAGGSLKVSVILGPNASSATAVGFTLQFDTAVASIASAADILKGDLLTDTNHEILINLSPGILQLTISSDTLVPFYTTQGKLVEIQFRIPPGASPGTRTDLRLSKVMVVSTSGLAMGVVSMDGSIQLEGGSGSTSTTTSTIAGSSTTSTVSTTSTSRASSSTTTTSTTSSTRPTTVPTTTSSTTSTTRATTTTTTSTTSSTIGSTSTTSTTTSTLPSTLAQPATVQTLSIDPTQGCPGFFIGDVSLAPGAAEGMWGIEIKLTAGERLLQGGLNLGGGFQENGGINGWGAFNIANPRNEAQEVNVLVDAQPLDTPGFSPAAFGLSIRLVQRVGQNDIPVGASVTGRPPLSFQRVVDPGFYILEVRSLPGSPRGTFQMAATTKFADRIGGGFQGGVVVGGYLARNTAGESLHGYAAFCISEGQAVSFQTYGWPNYAGVGAGNLVLAIKDRNQQIFWQSPIPTTTTTTTTITTSTSTTRATSTTTTSTTTSTARTIIITTTTTSSSSTSTSSTTSSTRASTTTSSTTSTFRAGSTTTSSTSTSTLGNRPTTAGTLTRDETWTPAMSPIRLTNDVTVPAGITLTIQPNVEVLFAKNPSGTGGSDPARTELLVAGTLNADGGAQVAITTIAFMSDAASPDAGDWGMIQVYQNGRGTFRSVYMSDAVSCIYARDSAQVFVDNSWFELCGDFSANVGGALLRGEDAGLEVRDTVIYDSLVGLFLFGNRAGFPVTAQRNQIQYNMFGAFLRGTVNPTLTGNNISINLIGLRATEKTAPVVYNNSFEANEVQGLEIRNEAVLSNFQRNNINNPPARLSAGFDLTYANAAVELSATNNYWGPFTEAEIETHIQHRPDDPALGLVRFVPFAAVPFRVPEGGVFAELIARREIRSLFRNAMVQDLENRMRGLP